MWRILSDRTPVSACSRASSVRITRRLSSRRRPGLVEFGAEAGRGRSRRRGPGPAGRARRPARRSVQQLGQRPACRTAPARRAPGELGRRRVQRLLGRLEQARQIASPPTGGRRAGRRGRADRRGPAPGARGRGPCRRRPSARRAARSRRIRCVEQGLDRVEPERDARRGSTSGRGQPVGQHAAPAGVMLRSTAAEQRALAAARLGALDLQAGPRGRIDGQRSSAAPPRRGGEQRGQLAGLGGLQVGGDQAQRRDLGAGCSAPKPSRVPTP